MLKKQQICLPNFIPTEGSACWIAGWKNDGPTTTLKVVDVNVLYADKCRSMRFLDSFLNNI